MRGIMTGDRYVAGKSAAASRLSQLVQLFFYFSRYSSVFMEFVFEYYIVVHAHAIIYICWFQSHFFYTVR